MEVLYPRCAGLDVHKDSVVACVRCVSEPAHREVRSFGTTTRELFALAEWLESHGCTHVAMEATGVYWKPVWHQLCRVNSSSRAGPMGALYSTTHWGSRGNRPYLCYYDLLKRS
jgi:hypothetical protein